MTDSIQKYTYCNKCKGTGWVHSTVDGIPVAKHCTECNGTGKDVKK